eukprot:4659414-Amphidinium_carterae.1
MPLSARIGGLRFWFCTMRLHASEVLRQLPPPAARVAVAASMRGCPPARWTTSIHIISPIVVQEASRQ